MEKTSSTQILKTNFIQWSKQTLYNGANKLNSMEQTNFIQWSKQTLQNTANKLYTMKRTNITQ